MDKVTFLKYEIWSEANSGMGVNLPQFANFKSEGVVYIWEV